MEATRLLLDGRVLRSEPGFTRWCRRAAKVAGISAASLAVALSAHAADVKLGAEGGALVFEPANVTIKAGDSVTWINNAGFPHNVVFDEDEIPVSLASPVYHQQLANSCSPILWESSGLL